MDAAVDRPPAEFEAPAWGSIESVCLDMDGTLLDLRFDNYFWLEVVPQRYGELHGVPAAVAREQLLPRIDAWRGRLEWYCVDHWTSELGIDIEALKVEVREHIRFLPGSEQFLERLGSLGKRRLLTTNAHPKALAVKDGQTGIGRYFDALVSSHVVGVAKESPEFWTRLAAGMPSSLPGRCSSTTARRCCAPRAMRASAGSIRCCRPDSTRPPRTPVPGISGIERLSQLL